MVVDFHTHAFPDNIAETAIAKLSVANDYVYTPVHDGTVSGLIGYMDRCGIDVSVIQPVILKASQVRKVNEWVRSICSDRIVGFGGIYPHAERYKEDIDFIAGLGLKGLKFHAEYQDFIADDVKMLRVYDYALSRGLIILHHAGADPGFLPPFKSSPRRFLNIAKHMEGGILIAAHLGGHDQWDDVEELLAGNGVYLDTSMGFEYYNHDQFIRILYKNGTDKVLFASDSPWSGAETELRRIRSLPLPGNVLSAVLGENAKRILNI